MDQRGKREIGLGIVGGLLLIAWTLILPTTRLGRLLSDEVGLGDLVAATEQRADEVGLAADRRVKTKELVDRHLLEHLLRTRTEGSYAVRTYRVTVTEEAKEEGKKRRQVEATWDSTGRLVAWSREGSRPVETEIKGGAVRIVRPDAEPLSIEEVGDVELDGAEAVGVARRWLEGEGYETGRFEVVEQKEKERDGLLNHDIVMEVALGDGVPVGERIEIRVVGEVVVDFEHEAKVPDDDETPARIAILVVRVTLAVLFWVGLLIAFMIVMFRQVKAERFDLKRSWWFGGGVGLLLAAGVATAAYDDWAGMVFGGGFAGLFTGLLAVLLFLVTESAMRQVWSEKLRLVDLVFHRRFLVREFGSALLSAVFLAGVVFTALALLLLLLGPTGLLWINFDGDSVWFLDSVREIVANALINMAGGVFLALFVFGFFPAVLRGRYGDNRKFSWLLMAGLFASLLDGMVLLPGWWSILLLVVVVPFWARLVVRSDLVSLYLSWCFVKVGWDLSGQLLRSEVARAVGPALVLAVVVVGIALRTRRETASDFTAYVPEYVSRLAEKERFERELEIARTIQTGFLPESTPELAGLDIAADCRPALLVGGDYFDFVEERDGELELLIGDVSGKGISAAFYMTMAKGIIRTVAKDRSDPAEVVSRINEVFWENTPRSVFITLLFARLDLAARRLVFARAGHSPLLVLRAGSDEPEFLCPAGLAIGLSGGDLFAQTVETVEIPYAKGDLFVFYTDGVNEAMSESGDEFGDERLAAIVRECRDLGADEILATVRERVFAFSGTVQHDDFTMVVVRVVD